MPKRASKPRTSTIIDFKELSQQYVSGSGLEALVRLLLAGMGIEADWTGVGQDGGKDLKFTDLEKGKVGARPFTWLVQCKDNSVANTSVSEIDIGAIRDKVEVHECDGYLLVTTTQVTSSLKQTLDGLKLKTKVWEQHELSQMLLEPKNESLLMQFLPNSYERVQQLKKSSTELKSKTSDNFQLVGSQDSNSGTWSVVTRTDLSVKGLSIELSYPQFDSTLSSDITEINLLLESDAIQTIHKIREQKARKRNPFEFYEPQEDGSVVENLAIRSFYISDFEVACLSRGVLSLIYHVTTFSTDAVRAECHTRVFNFELSPVIPLPLDLLMDGDYLDRLSAICRNALYRKIFVLDSQWSDDIDMSNRRDVVTAEESDAQQNDLSGPPLLIEGTAPIKANFERFYIADSGLVFIFDEGQVNDRRAGDYRILVPYRLLVGVLTHDTVLWAEGQASVATGEELD